MLRQTTMVSRGTGRDGSDCVSFDDGGGYIELPSTVTLTGDSPRAYCLWTKICCPPLTAARSSTPAAPAMALQENAPNSRYALLCKLVCNAVDEWQLR